ncbi:MAG: hypothetical protein WBP64_02280 [Nitrososphaeraceae archaeon]
MKSKPGLSNRKTRELENTTQTIIPNSDSWFTDLQKLSSDELVRMYNTIKSSDYEFAKDAWYNPLEIDKRCPIMVAKGYRTPDTPDKMIEFQDTAKTLEHEFRGFIDAWDFGVISIHDIETAILYLLECGSIEIREYSA